MSVILGNCSFSRTSDAMAWTWLLLVPEENLELESDSESGTIFRA
jgi:hypothetical protein